MKQANIRDFGLSETAHFGPGAAEYECSRRWRRLCDVYLPLKSAGTFWRFNRHIKPAEPSQGWKLHVSATVLQACDLFEKTAPFLASQNVRFKAPESLTELININSGLKYGYWQVGKFLTVYPSTSVEAVRLARELHEMTKEFISIAVPFDNQYLPESSVFYRYGAFEQIALKTENGTVLPALRNLSGELVYDDRLQPVPEWITDPFQSAAENTAAPGAEKTVTPLVTTYKVFRALTQRGKGGTYQALDLSGNPPRFCIVKEGRRYGELFWNGQDGYQLVRNEQRVLETLGKLCRRVPQLFSSFRAHGNFYLVMEYVEGQSLSSLMKSRRRRFSLRQILAYAVEIAAIIEEIHRAGWVWNDCKPANLIVTHDRSLRPVDFEGACRTDESAPFDWKSREFSKPGNRRSAAPEAADLYAFGAVLYFLLTGKFYDSGAPAEIEKLRRNVPQRLKAIIVKLLGAHDSPVIEPASEIRAELREIFNSRFPSLKDSRISGGRETLDPLVFRQKSDRS